MLLIGVSATGLQSFRQVGGLFLGRGMMVAILKQEGTVLWLRERLKMDVRTSVSLLAHALRARPWMLSGPAALWELMFLRTLCTWPDETGVLVCACLLAVVRLEVLKWV